jgi:putative transposase
VTLRFAYLAVLRMLGWMALLARSDLAQDTEILVLRHQIAVLQPHAKTPRPCWADRAILSALARLIPSKQRSQLRLIVSPRTSLRWHADIVKRHWCYPHRRPGRPAVQRTARDLALEMARDNPAGGYRRIHGELTGLGYTLAPSTVWKILNDAGIGPHPIGAARHGARSWPPRPRRSCRRTSSTPARSSRAACTCCSSSSTAPGACTWRASRPTRRVHG